MGIFNSITEMLSGVLTNIKSILDLDTIEKYKKIRKDRNLDEIKLKNGKDLIISFKDKFRDFSKIYNLMKNHIVNNKWLHFSESEITFIFSEKLLKTYNENSSSIEEVNNYIEKKSKNEISFKIPSYQELETLKNLNFFGGGYYWYKKDDDTYSTIYISGRNSYLGFGV